jgi:hypothetical protein
MAVGFSAVKTDIDNRAGNLSVSLRDVLRNVQIFKAFLDTQTDAGLQALGYSSGDVATLRSAYTDLDKLRQIYEGTATQGTTYDFRTFAKQLAGVI